MIRHCIEQDEQKYDNMDTETLEWKKKVLIEVLQLNPCNEVAMDVHNLLLTIGLKKRETNTVFKHLVQAISKLDECEIVINKSLELHFYGLGYCLNSRDLQKKVISILLRDVFLKSQFSHWQYFFQGLILSIHARESILAFITKLPCQILSKCQNATFSKVLLYICAFWCGCWTPNCSNDSTNIRELKTFDFDVTCQRMIKNNKHNFTMTFKSLTAALHAVFSWISSLPLSNNNTSSDSNLSHNVDQMTELYSATFERFGAIFIKTFVAQMLNRAKENSAPTHDLRQNVKTPNTNTRSITQNYLSHVLILRDLMSIHDGNHPQTILAIRKLLLRYYETIFECQQLSSLTASLKTIGKTSVLEELELLVKNAEFRISDQMFVIRPESYELFSGKTSNIPNNKQFEMLKISKIEVEVATLLLVKCACTDIKSEQSLQALSNALEPIKKNVAINFIKWASVTSGNVSERAKDRALHILENKMCPDELEQFFKMLAATVKSLSHKSLRQKWCASAHRHLMVLKTKAPEKEVSILNQPTNMRLCTEYLAICAFNDGVTNARASNFVEAEKMMSISMSLLSSHKTCTLKSRVNEGYFRILELLHITSNSKNDLIIDKVSKV